MRAVSPKDEWCGKGLGGSRGDLGGVCALGGGEMVRCGWA